MKMSYKKLWKLLIDKNMKKTDFVRAAIQIYIDIRNDNFTDPFV